MLYFLFKKIRYTEFILVLPIQNQDSNGMKLTSLFLCLYLFDPMAKILLAPTKHEKQSQNNNPNNTNAKLCIRKPTPSLIREFPLFPLQKSAFSKTQLLSQDHVVTLGPRACPLNAIMLKLFKSTKDKLWSSPMKGFKNSIYI